MRQAPITSRPAVKRPLAPTILEAMDDPQLLGGQFKGETWTAWRAFLAALFGLEMTPELAEIVQRHTDRTDLPAGRFKEATLICGRRAGKSRVLAFVATYLATCFDYREHLAPGEVGTVAIAASTKRQARGIFRYISGALSASPLLASMVKNETDEEIELDNRVVIEIAVAGWRVTRGYTYVAFLCDEAAYWRQDDSANPDEEIIRAVRPGLTTIPGAMLLKASSPYAKRGVLWKDYGKHYGKDGARILVFKASTEAMNPKADRQEIAEAFDEDPEAASAEYHAEFRDDLVDFVSPEVVDRCVTPGCGELAYMQSHSLDYVAFADPAGGSGGDSMTLAIAHSEMRGDVEHAVLDLVREWRPPFSPDAVVKECAEVLRAYGLRRVLGDRYAGSWPAERFQVHGIEYEASAKPKSEIYGELLPLLNSGRAQLLEIKRLRQQLLALERRTSRGGRDSIDHPAGGHDDVVNAAAGALTSCINGNAAVLRVWWAAYG